MRQRNRACLLAIVCFASLSWAGVPDWLKLTARQGLPAYKPETNAVVLLDETTTTVDSAGEVHTVYRKAYKVLRANAVASLSGIAVSYSEETQLTYLKGWAISAVGVEYEVKEKDAVERDTDEITDRRTKELDIPGVDVGGVVGFEYQQRGHPQLNEQIWHVQRTLPVVLSRYVLRLPAGWTYEVFWNNHDKVEPKKNGSDLIWELAN